MKFMKIENRTDSSLYQERMEVRFCDCDPSHRMKMSELFRVMTNMADMAFEFRGMDHQYLMERGVVFLISQVSVRIHQMPVQTDLIQVATWEEKIERAKFLRNFAVWDVKNGEQLVEASSTWMMVNPVTRSILRPAQFTGSLYPMLEETSGAPAFIRLKLPEGEEGVRYAGPRKVVYSDLDGNGHVDNARFIEITADALSQRMMEHPLETLQVVFNKEAMLGDTMEMYVRETSNGAVVKGMTNGKDNFVCALTFAGETEENKNA